MNEAGPISNADADSSGGEGKRVAPLLMSEEHDNLARIAYQLLVELWIARDRIAVLEELLAEKDIIARGEIDRYQPTGEFAAKLELLRDHMIENVAGAPFVMDLTIDQLMERGRRLGRIVG